VRILFVTPSEVSSGECLTALNMAENILAGGGEIRFLASAFTANFIRHTFRERVGELTGNLERNLEIWADALRTFKPDVLVFADYPLLFFSSGAPPLANEAWVQSLENLDAALVTLDHLNYAQRPMNIFFGPPHLSNHCERTPELPRRMQILLPCPVHEPASVAGRKGEPFRYWKLPLGLTPDQRRKFRRSYLHNERDLLLFHSTPNWAWRLAEQLGLPYYSFLTNILEYYLASLPRSVTVVSVNNGHLLTPSNSPNIHVLNLAALSKEEYAGLLFSCDLMITENRVSVSLGKAVCGLVPCAVLHNTYRLTEILSQADKALCRLVMEMERVRLGAIFPHEVFPIWGQNDLEQLGLFDQNSFATACESIEVWGGKATEQQFRELLTNEDRRAKLQARQQNYLRQLSSLPDASEALHRIAQREQRV
jgi:hypothetical protein